MEMNVTFAEFNGALACSVDGARAYLMALSFDPAAYEEAAVAIANMVGTGGETTVDYCRYRGEMGYPLVPIANDSLGGNAHAAEATLHEDETHSANDASVDEPTYLDNLESIRRILNPAMSDLARALEVSRQSIYDWIGGGPIAAENAKKVRELALVAQLFEEAGISGSNQLLRREIGGKSFYDRFRSGESAEVIGTALVSIARRETEQKEALNKRLKNRPPLITLAEDTGTPHLSETG
jgi:hypothetical protein